MTGKDGCVLSRVMAPVATPAAGLSMALSGLLRHWAKDEGVAAVNAVRLALAWVLGDVTKDLSGRLCLDRVKAEVPNDEEATLLSALADRSAERRAAELLRDVVRIAAWLGSVYDPTTDVVRGDT